MRLGGTDLGCWSVAQSTGSRPAPESKHTPTTRQFNRRVTRPSRAETILILTTDTLFPMPSLKPKLQDKKDPKKQKSLLGWLSNPAAAKGASSSLEQPRLGAVNPSTTSSSPGGRDSIFETPSTKRRTNNRAISPAVKSATYTRSSEDGRSVNETPPTSDPIDVDIFSDEDIPNREMKSVCDTHIRAYTLIVSEFCAPDSRKTKDGHRRFRRRRRRRQ